ncbi:hypothetical protein LTS18_002014 [Coniosporium uncinatum]|uniref:Uncharacterized protein n=1 Tax=Coniosporium uncinatum TaxID=93489 RepID=A0ACC3D7Z7_9PEZI|nr:hypothetical protein LTS18_002014 [Coniosporium uncinatum]
MAEGDVGGTKAGGARASDSINKREKANEDMYIREQEQQKLKTLKDKIEAQERHLKELKDHMYVDSIAN